MKTQTELTWGNGFDDQLNRQLRWQQIRNEFYGNMRYDAKNSAAHARANETRGWAAGDSDPIDRRLGKAEELQSRCKTAADFYHHIVCVHDRALKQAMRDGDHAEHARLLDKSNEIISAMTEYTNLALSFSGI